MRNQAKQHPTLAVIGNLTLDEVRRDGSLTVFPGGSALYVSATAAFLGLTVRVRSSVGPDYPLSHLQWLRRRGINVEEVIISNAPTTRFGLTYRGDSRTLRILHPGKQISAGPLKVPLDGTHLGPVFGEVALSAVPLFRRNSRLLSADLQGFLRHKGPRGLVQLRQERIGSLLRFFDIIKLTSDEAMVQTSTPDIPSAAKLLLQRGAQRLVITMGSGGALFAQKGFGMLRIPAYPESTPLDPTGAGDAMVGGWLATFLLTGDSVWSASVGSAIASIVVRNWGPAKFHFSRKELFQRSAWVYNRIGHEVGQGC